MVLCSPIYQLSTVMVNSLENQMSGLGYPAPLPWQSGNGWVVRLGSSLLLDDPAGDANEAGKKSKRKIKEHGRHLIPLRYGSFLMDQIGP